MHHYATLHVTLSHHIAMIKLNRPQKANAIDAQMLLDLKNALQWVDEERAVRVVILSGEGASFCAGLDLKFFQEKLEAKEKCHGRERENLRAFIKEIQDVFSSIENIRKPVIAQVHGACIGGGLDMISACDLRYCSNAAFFSIKEVDLGFTADVGSLQRLPFLMNRGLIHELAYTGRRINGIDAEAMGLVNACLADEEALGKKVMEVATLISAKSPLAVRGIKEMLRYARDHSVQDALNYNATWNAAMMLSQDMEEAFQSTLEKRQPEFKE